MPKSIKANLINEKTLNVIHKFMIFQKLSANDIKKLLNVNADEENEDYQNRLVKLSHYKEGESVIHEGDFDSWSYWVVKGIFDVIQNGKPLTSFSTPGQIFGEMSVLEGIPRTASVIAVTDGICLGIDMSVIDSLDDDRIRGIIKKSFYSVILNRLSDTKSQLMDEKKKLDQKVEDLIHFEEKIKRKSLDGE